MEDQDRETRLDEDVEGHMHQGVNKGAVNKGRNLNKDEDDVEGHMNKGAVNKGRNIAKDDEDDVEGHMNLNAVNKGMHKN